MNQAIRVLKAIPHAALDDDCPDFKNPVHKIGWNKLKRRTGCITLPEMEKWFSAVLACENPSFRDFVLFLMFTGLRREEAASLQWPQVDLKKRCIIISETKNREPHTLPITPVLQDILERRRKTANEKNLHVFLGRYEGTSLRRADKSFERVKTAFGRPFILHDLRRTFVTVGESLDLTRYTLKLLVNHRSDNDPTFDYVIGSAERLRDPLTRIQDRILEAANLK